MDNKYGLGSSKVAHVRHDAKHPTSGTAEHTCRHCGNSPLVLCTTMDDHFCPACGQYQSDLPAGYSTGRSADY